MPHYEIHAIEKETNTVVTTVIQTSIPPSKVKKEVEKGGLKVLKINSLDEKQVAIYERMRVLSNKRNIVGLSMVSKDIKQTRILWARVIAAVIVAAALVLCLLSFL